MKRLLILLAFAAASHAQGAAHSVTLTWSWSQGSGGAATSFQISRGTTSGTLAPLASVPAGTLTYVDTSGAGNVLVEGTTYFYVVQAMNSAGVSAPSNQASVIIPATVPLSPSGLIAVAK